MLNCLPDRRRGFSILSSWERNPKRNQRNKLEKSCLAILVNGMQRFV